jgi:Ca2+:H+ antiporter
VTALIVIIAVILICAFGVVTEAEHLANRLGDPYGSLVLTISICLIEVILIAAVLLGPGDHATIARDSVMAVSMIILAPSSACACSSAGCAMARSPTIARASRTTSS